ncbi:hypothetical protein ACHAXT_007406 [Thalassiosira profunda]
MADEARASLEKSRLEVMECEAEIKSLKEALKSLALGAGAGEGSSPNRLEVAVRAAKPADAGTGGEGVSFKVHLSSPIEERDLARVRDPLDPAAEGSVAAFESIETANALLTVEVYSQDGSKVGSSAPHDLLPLCQDVELWRKGGEKKASTLEVAIVEDKGVDGHIGEVEAVPVAVEEEVKRTESADAFEDAKEEMDESAEGKDAGETKESTDEAASEEFKTPEPEAAQDESKPAELQLPVYTVTLQLEYTPSPDDRRDALYDRLNAVSKRKVAAIDALRKHAGVVNRAKAAEASSVVSSPGKKSAVKPGFLNKAKEETPPPAWKRWYDKTLGPKSMLWMVGPVAKNYVIFLGVGLFIHWKGDLLALPPPV